MPASGVDRKALFEAINQDLTDRSAWEQKQTQLYKARYRGLRRTNPPWPNASDVNWPLIDSVVERLKPFYLQQIYATDLLATFQAAPGSGNAVAAGFCTAAAQWFNFQLKEQSNFETELIYLIDYLLMLGRPAMKVTWDTDAKRLKFTVIEPSRLILPSYTTNIEDADRLVHVLTFSKEAYARQPGYNQGIIDQITGPGETGDQHGEGVTASDRLRREGITDAVTGRIIVWECWTRDKAGKWQVESFSPKLPEATVKARSGAVTFPFVDFPHELTQPEWHAPRGIGEIILVWQAQLTKLLNSKNDALTLYNSPLFRSERDGPNTVNLRWKPGSILPIGVQPVQMPSPPVSWDMQINLVREVAEGLAGTPDFGMSRRGDVKEARTATEMEMIQANNAQSSDLRMRVFRMNLGRLYRVAWDTLRAFATGDKYEAMIEDEMKAIDPQAIRGDYKIRPSGSADGVTRARLWQKAMSRLQSFVNDPFINQGELRKSVLEADDAGLVKRLYQDPGMKQATQAEDQASEVAIMRLGFPALVNPADDHATHIRTLLTYVAQQQQAGEPPKPAEMQMIQAHLAEHIQALQQVDPKAAKGAMDAIQVIGAAMNAGQQQQNRRTERQPPGTTGACNNNAQETKSA